VGKQSVKVACPPVDPYFTPNRPAVNPCLWKNQKKVHFSATGPLGRVNRTRQSRQQAAIYTPRSKNASAFSLISYLATAPGVLVVRAILS
jgi:hypothetical protein